MKLNIKNTFIKPSVVAIAATASFFGCHTLSASADTAQPIANADVHIIFDCVKKTTSSNTADLQCTPVNQPAAESVTILNKTANAPKKNGFYFDLSTGFENRAQATEITPATQGNTWLTFYNGIDINSQIGYHFGNWRISAEYSLMNNGVNNGSAAIAPGVGTGVLHANTGGITLNAYMLNVAYDFTIKNSPWKPYLGVGIGIYNSQINSLSLNGAGNAFTSTTTGYPIAWQVRAGIGYQINPTWEVYAGYKYFNGGNLSFAANGMGTYGNPNGQFQPPGANINAAEFGLRAFF
jgi:opacity protein-like surface antigen